MTLSNDIALWSESPIGDYFLQWLTPRADKILETLFGYYALQIGFNQHDLLKNSRIVHKYQYASSGLVHCCGDEELLPFANQSIDVVVLPLIINFVHSPHHLLREVERILVPEGQLIICGFNPASLWGMRRFLGNRKTFPWNGRYISVAKLKDWLSLLEMQTQAGYFGCFVPPINQVNWIKRSKIMDKMGDRWWAYFGGVYLIQAIKRVAEIKLIGPNWQKKKPSAFSATASYRNKK